MKKIPYILTVAFMFIISLNVKAGLDTTAVSLNTVTNYDIEESTAVEEELTVEDWMVTLDSWNTTLDVVEETYIEEELQLENWMFNFEIKNEKFIDIAETEIELKDWMFNFDIKTNESPYLAESVIQSEN